MVEKGEVFAGNVFSHDRWDEYWEGTLKRDNGNIGTLTTRSNVWSGNYGVTDRLNVLASLPYVWTRASQGVLQSMQGVQDLSLTAKYSVVEKPSAAVGHVRLIGALTAGLPLTDYTPDFYPLSIGSASRRLSARGTLNVQSAPGWFLNGSTAYTWRAGVTLDRPYYFTDGQLFLTDEVSVPDVFDYVLSAGYMKRGLMAAFSVTNQHTQGGGDVRRQDMPFVAHRMNYTKVGGMLMYPIPKFERLRAHVAYSYTPTGRNVGQATTVTGGALYTFQVRRTK